MRRAEVGQPETMADTAPLIRSSRPGPSARRPIVIGASTGGVEALYEVLSAMPDDCPPIFVVQHMRPDFTASFVAGLDQVCKAHVMLGQDRNIARPGHIYIAPPGDMHMIVMSAGTLSTRLVAGPPVQGHRPSVDKLFHAAATLGVPPAAALLTGMGRDGAEGLLAIRNAGGPTMAQDQASAVVYGMPRVAHELGAAEKVLPLSRIASALLHAAGHFHLEKR